MLSIDTQSVKTSPFVQQERGMDGKKCPVFELPLMNIFLVIVTTCFISLALY